MTENEGLMHKIFVYGTLKRGYPNFDIGMDGTTFVGEYRTVERFPLVIGGPWFSPNLIDEPGSGHQVKGEIFTATDVAVEFLDRFESTHVPTGYRRVERSFEALDGSTNVMAWVYVRDRVNIDAVVEELTDSYPLEHRYIIPSKRPKT
ncbi:MAG: gamma-glutamylcyclotransferase [Alphaproteobacteria bacterium]|nr:gamma-glutamylcyclotransferase [Alphaproteobacteria bacterium]MBT4084892.1 gamma-glutamylcyclotransferase [Alphaproteobacteria bacterium]